MDIMTNCRELVLFTLVFTLGKCTVIDDFTNIKDIVTTTIDKGVFTVVDEYFCSEAIVDNKLDEIKEVTDEISHNSKKQMNTIIDTNRAGVDEIIKMNNKGIDNISEIIRKRTKEMNERNGALMSEMNEQSKEGVKKIIDSNIEGMNNVAEHIKVSVKGIIDQNKNRVEEILQKNTDGVTKIIENNNEGVKHMVTHYNAGFNQTIDSYKELEKKIMTVVTDVNHKIGRIDEQMGYVALASKRTLEDSIPNHVRTELHINALFELHAKLSTSDNDFQQFTERRYSGDGTLLQYDHHSLESFATHAVSHDPDSVQGLMHQMHHLICPEADDGTLFLRPGVLKVIAKQLQKYQKSRKEYVGDNPLCHQQQSPQQILRNLFDLLQMTQLKAFIKMQFSWLVLRLFKKGTFKKESLKLTETYVKRVIEQAKSLKEALEEVDSAYWRCDPQVHVEGETYLQVRKFLQGYLQNAINFHGNSKCTEGCNHTYKTNPWTAQGSCYKDEDKGKLGCPLQDACSGQLLECQSTTSDMSVCYADLEASSRTYEWIKNGDKGYFGNYTTDVFCHKERKETGFRKDKDCSLCFCLCAHQETSEKTFSLRSVLSSIEENKVITGIRFVKRNKVFQIEIQEGVLEDYGSIDQSSVSWKIDNIPFIKEKFNEYMDLEYNERSIDFDDLIAPPGHVITGIKFAREGGHLKLKIKATPYNFMTGKLNKESDVWLSADQRSQRSARMELHLESPHSPLYADTQSVVDSRNNTFMQFTHSDVQKDAAQTAVPFLDAQPVAPHPPVPLAGVGLYHKGQKGFGGFVGLKVFTYNYGHHLDTMLENFDIDAEVPNFKI